MKEHVPVARIVRLFFGFGLAASPSFGAPPPPKQPAQPKSVQSMLDVYDKCRQGGALDLVGILGTATPETALLRQSINEATRANLALYQACREPMQGGTGGCEALSGIQDAAADCRELAGYATFAWAVFNNGDALSACARFTSRRDVEMTRAGRRAGRGGNRAKKCEYFISALKSGDTAAICSQLGAAGLLNYPDAPAECRRRMAYFGVSSGGCDSVSDKVGRVFCREEVALSGALRARDLSACAASPWCVSLSSLKPDSCDPYLLRAKKSFCDRLGRDVEAAEKSLSAGEAERRKQDRSKAKYSKNQPMQMIPPDVEKAMRRVEGRKAPRGTAAPAPSPDAGAAPEKGGP